MEGRLLVMMRICVIYSTTENNNNKPSKTNRIASYKNGKPTANSETSGFAQHSVAPLLLRIDRHNSESLKNTT